MIRFNDIIIDRATMTITIGNVVRKFPKLMFAAVSHLLLNEWTCKEDLWQRLYGNDPDGGPNQGLMTLDVNLCHWRPKLKVLGLAIEKEKRCGVIWYKLVQLKEAVAA